jgi:translation initiation factor 1 (eIF-1/SUI1)
MKQALMEALVKGDHSLLGGYLHALLSYPERIHDGLIVEHPHTRQIVAMAPALEGIMPKEEELVAIIKQESQQHRKTLVYIQNSNTTDISPKLVELLEKENIKVKVLKNTAVIKSYVESGIDVLITNPKKVEVGMDLLDFPTIIFYQIPMSTYTLRQASRRSWRIPQKRPVKVFFLTYERTMQTRLMKLMADKLMCSLALEGELTDKGLAALSESSDSMVQELAKMLIENSDNSESLRDIWSDYRKKEVRVEQSISKGIEAPEIPQETIEHEEEKHPLPNIKKASTEVEKIGDRVVKVQFIEYIGKRKKIITHIEVKEAELDDMLAQTDKPIQVQYSLF